jgi:hypothetical protein
MYWPDYAIKHTHRMIFAIMQLLGTAGPAESFRSKKSLEKRRFLASELKKDTPGSLNDPHFLGLDSWPGLRLDI